MFEKFLIIIISLLIAIKCEPKPKEFIAINNKLAFDLLNTFPNDGNNFFSPLSLTNSLLMLLNGARGLTEQQVRKRLGIGDQTDLNLINEELRDSLQSIIQRESDKLVIKLANRLVVSKDYPLNEDYQHLMSEMFDSTVDSVDFVRNGKQITEDINNWVSNQTNYKIKKLLNEKDITRDTALVLLNAIYFKGVWKYLFDKKKTKKDNFHNYGLEETVPVNMMSLKRSLPVKYMKDLDADMFEMPFASESDISMIIILPNQLNGLREVTKTLSAKALNETLFKLKQRKGLTFTLKFPKFKIESEYDLKNSFEKLGMDSMFKDSADLSAISDKSLKISKAIHKAYIEVNEEGAEAAAVTAFIAGFRSLRSNSIVVDRPFMFAIVDKNSGLILFLGQIRKL